MRFGCVADDEPTGRRAPGATVIFSARFGKAGFKTEGSLAPAIDLVRLEAGVWFPRLHVDG